MLFSIIFHDKTHFSEYPCIIISIEFISVSGIAGSESICVWNFCSSCSTEQVFCSVFWRGWMNLYSYSVVVQRSYLNRFLINHSNFLKPIFSLSQKTASYILAFLPRISSLPICLSKSYLSALVGHTQLQVAKCK